MNRHKKKNGQNYIWIPAGVTVVWKKNFRTNKIEPVIVSRKGYRRKV